MNSTEHKFVGPSMHDRLIGALDTCCRQGEMLRIQNRHVDWEHHRRTAEAMTGVWERRRQLRAVGQ
jgi:hypothetical protein